MKKRQSAKRPGRLKRAIVDIAVPCVMALSATAFSAGLFLQGGIGLVSSVIAGVTLFLVMICSQAAYISSHRAAYAGDRFGELEAALKSIGGGERGEGLAQLAAKVEKIGSVAERVEEIDAVSERVEQLYRDISQMRPEEFDFDPSRIGRLAAEVDRISNRQEALRSQFQIEVKERFENLSAELKMLETLVKQVAEGAAGRGAQGVRPAAAQAASGGAETARAETGAQASQDQSGGAAPSPASLEPVIDELPMMDEVRQSIESNRIELYLQPIMTLPQRRVRYYEALTRLRSETGRLLMPREYLGPAQSAGIMSVIDNVMLYRSVQVLRRLEQRSSARAMFCNISVHSMLDPEFFTEFISFMEQNRALAESMYFEFPQEMIDQSGPVEQESLDALAALGFRFSLDQVTSLDLDFHALHARGFRFIKVDAGILLHGMAEAKAQIHAADMNSYLERFGLQLIVSKVESEQELSGLLDYHVKLGQGFLFSEPRPVRPEVFSMQDSEAAA